MDSYREIDADTGPDKGLGEDSAYDVYDDDAGDDAVMDARHSFGNDERRMHVRAYNFWAGLLDDKNFPSIEDFDPDDIEDFGPQSVLLDFTAGLENPAISFLGDALARECSIEGDIGYISDVPQRSLLSRITDHYMQIIANQAPIGFEAEFVNQRGATILYRGILLPFSSDDDTIDFICGVINWKEMADHAISDELSEEVGRAMAAATPRKMEQVPIWADGPSSDAPMNDEQLGERAGGQASEDTGIMSASAFLPLPDFAAVDSDAEVQYLADTDTTTLELSIPAGDLEEPDREDAEIAWPAVPSGDHACLADWLENARETAARAIHSEERTRGALYHAIGRAYDFSVMAARQPQQFQALLGDSGLKMQDRAPMTPVVKLVFGAAYDKTRLTEYAAALSHAHRHDLPIGSMAGYLERYKGGLKGVVREERRARRPDTHHVHADKLQAAYQQLRETRTMELGTIDSGNAEFVVLVARRLENGALGIVGAVAGDEKLTDKAVAAIAS